MGAVIARVLRLAVVLAVAAASVAVGPVRAAEPTFGQGAIEGSLGEGLEFSQAVTLDTVPDRVELLVTYADAFGPLAITVAPPSSSGRTTLRHAHVESDGHIPPNTPIRARWRITTGASAVEGPEVRTVYADERFDWQTVSGDLVRVHWYEGSRAFGERALRIGEQAVRETADLLGVSEDEPIDFFIYPDQNDFYDALGPGTRENVGGQAHADIRTLFALIAPSAIDDPWVDIVVPHELVHLVFDTASGNPYHFPAHWLNEGLAVYLSQGYDAGDRGLVDRAARAGELIPLDGLVGQFPTSGDRFGLAYAESVSAVDFIIRTHGRDAVVSIIRSYADGRTDDEAFEAAIGLNAADLNDAWLADLGAVVPTRHGPQPAPPGPEPSAIDPSAPRPGSPSMSASTLIAIVVALGVGLAVVGLVLRRRGQDRRADAPPPDAPLS